MSPGAFAIALWIAIGLDQGLSPVFRVGESGIEPSFVLPLMVFVGLFATGRAAAAAALVTGLCIDLLSPVTMSDGTIAAIPGPHALGMLLAMQLVLGARGLVFLNSPVTLVVLTPLAGSVAQIVVTSVFAIRELYDPIGFQPAPELGRRVLAMLLSSGSAVVIWIAAMPAIRWFRFEAPHVSRWTARR
ncbi:MAG: hypothetical protein ACTS22_03030 [Phycisphaerales bacterium]